MHELAADVQHIGAVALFSEVQASYIIGTPTEVTVPNPLAGYTERRTPKSLLGAGKKRHQRITSTLARADEALGDLQTGMNAYSASGATGSSLQDIVSDSRGTQILRKLEDNGNQKMILRGAAVSPFLKVSKDLTAEAQGKDPKEFGWEDWLKSASEEQLTNFSQWYTERLKVLSDPENKAEYIEKLKTGYKGRVEKAMQEGWIDGKHKAVLDTKLERADVRFFSPFGQMPDQVGGLSQKRGLGKNIVLIPTLTGEQVVVHELGHVFAGIDGKNMGDYFIHKLGKEYVAQNYSKFEHLYTILNEGYNEHMTEALIDSEPTVIRPTEREARGIAEAQGNSELYKSYREVFGVLVGGENGTVSGSDMKEIVDSMVTGNFGNLARHIDQKWGGRDVLTGVVEVVIEHDRGMWRNFDNPDYNEELLAKKIIERLHKGKNGRDLPISRT